MENSPETVETLEDILSDFASLDAAAEIVASGGAAPAPFKAPVEPICDFEVGLQWFNCSEPLSIGRQLRGKIVVLDFFTYCCINCLHILPHLRKVEERFSTENGVVVIGVHSAKFDNEKDSENISAALKRYDITHPVVNDCEGELWSKLGISCWPTVLVLGPEGQPLYKLVGEFNADHLVDFISRVVTYFGSHGKLSPHSLPLSSSTSVLKGPLLFPGKITSTTQQDGLELVAVANSGLHTVIITSADGIIKHVIGNSGKPGFADGNFSTALFNAPQGLAFAQCDVLFVADTENHAIRKIDLTKETVITIVGNTLKAAGNDGSTVYNANGISSPWDLCFVRRQVPSTRHLPQPFMSICPPAPPGHISLSGVPVLPPPEPPCIPPAPAPPCMPPAPAPPFMPLAPGPPCMPPAPAPPCMPPAPAPSCMPPAPAPPCIPAPPPPGTSAFAQEITEEESLKEQEVLFIAMAGCHQIWALFFQDTTWWGKEFFVAGTCVNVAGSGSEANRNNSYPRSASFAQPSGLTYSSKLDEIYIADSESSSIRSISLKTGKVSAVVGGSKTPDDLFSFGDIDGNGFNAKLQHPLGVAWHDRSESLFVADSYNHKIKIVKPGVNSCVAYIGTGKPGNLLSGLKSQLHEPGGLCVNKTGTELYIADTNNHTIKVFNFSTCTITELALICGDKEPEDKTDEALKAIPLTVNFGGKIMLHVGLSLPPQLQLTEGAPQRWSLHLPGLSWKCDASSGVFDSESSTASISVTAPAYDQHQHQSLNKIRLTTKLFVCVDSVCKVATPSLSFTVKCDAKSTNEVIYKSTLAL
ncbi:NHL repeat-containing protein 2 [Thrips palmi]|uniref:NHL repeat-containing protein 2 n=1 Tax=Thrips palmi TaxID=161013 RepID=A0A6P8YD33_THRPL|nr:NHL repeat-containing protein 2 [Thrips palmi]